VLVREFQVRRNLDLYTDEFMAPAKGSYPLDQVPVMRVDKNGERELAALEWGFLPFLWKPSGRRTKRTRAQRKCVNAISEELESKPTYRAAFKSQRRLMPATEFLEPDLLFSLPADRLFAFAALWDDWKGFDGEMVQSCTMPMTAANAEVAPVNDRMSLVLTSEAQYARWLDPEISTREPLKTAMQAIGDGVLLSRQLKDEA
jgi:putative SOS response-associated peptidase YedK